MEKMKGEWLVMTFKEAVKLGAGFALGAGLMGGLVQLFVEKMETTKE